MSIEKITHIEHSGVYANGVEITDIYCGGCRKFVEFKTRGVAPYALADMNTCGCVPVKGRFALETKGNILCKRSYMYDEDEETEDEESDEEEEEEESDEEDDEACIACSKCRRFMGDHTIVDSYRCGLITKEQAREGLERIR